jgi:hypothetical protein
MVGLEQVRRGILTYINRELAPLLPTWQGVLIEALAPTVLDAKTKEILNGKLLTGTGLVEGSAINVDEIYRSLKVSAQGRWPMEIAGFRFSDSDLDKLYRYVKEG